MNFEFITAPRIVFGPGALKQVGAAAAALGRHALVLVGGNVDRTRPLFEILGEHGVAATPYLVEDEPTVEFVVAGVEAARAAGCDLMIGFGGGSSLDSAKAIAALLTNPGDPFDYLEVIGRALPLPNAPAPVIAIPTTSGTGSEVTRNAVLASTEHKVKVSLRSPLMLPRVAIVDPLLTHSVPPAVTASTGMDALTQLLEPFTSIKATPMTDALCREAMPRAARSLVRVYRDGSDAEAREDLAFASLCGGLALANAGLGAVHGIAGPFGGMIHAPHGATCAALLAPITEANVAALRRRDFDGRALERYREAATLCTGRPDAGPDDLVIWLRELTAALAIPGLSAYGLDEGAFEELIAKSLISSSMKGNPVVLSAEELTVALRQAL